VSRTRTKVSLSAVILVRPTSRAINAVRCFVLCLQIAACAPAGLPHTLHIELDEGDGKLLDERIAGGSVAHCGNSAKEIEKFITNVSSRFSLSLSLSLSRSLSLSLSVSLSLSLSL